MQPLLQLTEITLDVPNNSVKTKGWFGKQANNTQSCHGLRTSYLRTQERQRIEKRRLERKQSEQAVRTRNQEFLTTFKNLKVRLF